MDKKKKLHNIKREKSIQWTLLCAVGKLENVLIHRVTYNEINECNEQVHIELLNKHNGKSTSHINVTSSTTKPFELSYPELYEVPVIDLDPANPLLMLTGTAMYIDTEII